MILIRRTNGKATEEYVENFPVSELQRGTTVTLSMYNGTRCCAVIEEASESHITTQGDASFRGSWIDREDVNTIELGW
jgi:hypothetical protein